MSLDGSNKGEMVDSVSRRSSEIGSKTDSMWTEQALKNFRQSVHAWSEASYEPAAHRGASGRSTAAGGWLRLGAGMRAGCGQPGGRGLRASSAAGSQPGQAWRSAAGQAAAAVGRAAERTDRRRGSAGQGGQRCFAEVPAAMEPLAQLMDEDGSQ